LADAFASIFRIVQWQAVQPEPALVSRMTHFIVRTVPASIAFSISASVIRKQWQTTLLRGDFACWVFWEANDDIFENSIRKKVGL
jgi:hypothetical protein